MTYSPASLDALTFLLADVRGALGPYLTVYLVSSHGWTQTTVGLMTTVAGLAGVTLQTPIGGLIDTITARRGAIVAALAVLAAGTLVLFATPSFWPVTAANAAIAVVGDVFGPAITALTLGLTARAAFARRIGRNSAFDHAGNVAIALLVGLVGTLVSRRAVFLLVPLCALAAMVATLTIPARAIDNARARGADDGDGSGDRHGVLALLSRRPILVLALSVFLFHLGNAAMLPLVGQELAARHPRLADGMLSLCIIAAQAVMLPVALLVGHRADAWGRKPIFLAAFAILPLRGVLFTLSHNAAWLVGVQVLDGIGAGIYGALIPLIVADLTRDTGRFNLAQGFIATTMGVGAAISPTLAGFMHDHAGGYRAAWFTLAAVALVGLAVFGTAMPETGPTAARSTPA